MSMSAGKLRDRVTFQQKSTGQDSLGQPLDVWTNIPTLPTVWANIRYQNGKEFIAADKNTSQIQASIRIRRRNDITPLMRVVSNGRIFNIAAVLPDDSNEWVDIAVNVGANKG